MRMQLNKKISVLLFGLLGPWSMGQEMASKNKVNLEDIEISFLTSYYQQDGENSPVTGGTGTEFLTNIAPAILVNVPIDSVHSISLYGGVDFYTSASSDNIDNPYLADHVSSASSSDVRGYATLTYKNKNKNKGITKGVIAGFSAEYDVKSASIGGLYNFNSKDNNRELGIKAVYYFDDWQLIFPTELRGSPGATLETDKRHSLNLSLTGSSILTKRLALSLTSDFVYQAGLLSTPFHRVYFAGQSLDPLAPSLANLEKLPNSRIKIPIGLRLNLFPSDYFIVRTYYRYYWDNWNVQGHTAKLEIPIKLGESLRLSPFYRYHRQSKAEYFAPIFQHSGLEDFYTSDFDLSGFSSNQFGAGLDISPLFGISRYRSPVNRDKAGMLKNIELRYAYYMRSPLDGSEDGKLNAGIFSFALNFTIPQ